MQQNYNYSLQQVLQSEGGYTNDPRDPGGATNFGITIADYRMYINSNGTALDVKNMTKSQAETIYKSKYWNKVNGDVLPSGVDYCVFDYGVNSGVSRANQVYLNLKSSDPADTINAICDERLHFLQGLHTWSSFGKGWASRVAKVRSGALQLANQPTSSVPYLDDINNQVSSVSNFIRTTKSFLSDNIGSLGRHISTGAIAAGGSASAIFTNDWPYILGGAVILSLVIWAGLKIYERNH